MKLTQITSTSDQELVQLIADQRSALAKLMIENRTKKMTNVKQVQATKKTISRALTIQRERQLAADEKKAGEESHG